MFCFNILVDMLQRYLCNFIKSLPAGDVSVVFMSVLFCPEDINPLVDRAMSTESFKKGAAAAKRLCKLTDRTAENDILSCEHISVVL